MDEFVAKVVVVGAGAVGAATALSLIHRSVAREIVLIDRNAARARGVALDMGYGAALSHFVDIRAGGYEEAAGAELVIVTAGANEKAGGATDRSDPEGRLKLLDTNAAVYRDVIPQVVAVCPDVPIMVVTDPPDPLAELGRQLAGSERVFSTGTVLDSMRFKVHLARHFKVRPADVNAWVVGEHGTSQVFLWSSAAVAGTPVLDLLAREKEPVGEIQARIEADIRYANINIIEGTGASQYGIGMVAARLTEAVLRDEGEIFAIASHNSRYGVTLALPTSLAGNGPGRTYEPPMTDAEHTALERSAQVLLAASKRVL